MNLTVLDPVLRGVNAAGVVLRVENLWDACGLSFLCPACWRRNEGREGTHRIHVWFEGAPPDLGGPGNASRWKVTGTSVHDLSLVDSVDVKTPCANAGDPSRPHKGWHGHVRAGKVTDA